MQLTPLYLQKKTSTPQAPLIMTRKSLNVIFTSVFLWNVAAAMSLLEGRFVTITNVEGIVNLSLDFEEMQKNGDANITSLYREGGSSLHFVGIDSNTVKHTLSIEHTISIAHIGQMTTEMADDLFFNVYRNYFEKQRLALADNSIFSDVQSTNQYADTIVSDLLNRSKNNEAVEAMLVLNVWMYSVHQLHNIVRSCYDDHDAIKSTVHLDKAAALWIGIDQEPNNSANGHLLYKLTEEASRRFNQEKVDDQANDHIIELFNSIQLDLSTGLDCSEQSTSEIIRSNIYRLIDLMSVPLIQNLIHHVLNVESDKSPELMDLYMAAIMPRLSACDANLAEQIFIDSNSTLNDDSMRAKWLTSLQKSFSCFKLSCDDIGDYRSGSFPTCKDESEPIPLVGYQATSTGTRALSFIDRDVQLLEILLDQDAYIAATEIYIHGYHSVHSLKELASLSNVPGSKSSLFEVYYDSDPSSAHKEILEALQRKYHYEDASSDQIRSAVVGLVKAEVLFWNALSSFEYSMKELLQGKKEEALKYWDMGAALFIGSIEGESIGGRLNGQSLYSIAKQMCREFDKCDENGNAEINSVIISSISEGAAFIKSDDIKSLKVIIDDVLLPALQVPLIQGSLFYGSERIRRSQDGSRGSAHAFSRGILPLVDDANEMSGLIIDDNLKFETNPQAQSSDTLEALGEAFLFAIPSMGVRCKDIGSLSSYPSIDLCLMNSANQIALKLFPIFSFETYRKYSSISLDVRDIMTAESVEGAKVVYKNGANGSSSLASYSKNASTIMSQDPTFNIFKYAIYDKLAFVEENRETFDYAHEIIGEIFDGSGAIDLGGEASVVLNAWMMIAHKLHNTVRTCKEKGNALEEIDGAVALWIGQNELGGHGSNGWMLYSIAERAAATFGLKESRINIQLASQFNELQSEAKKCHAHQDIHLDLRIRSTEILRLLSIPLIQQLFINIEWDNKDAVEVYAKSVIPLSVACSPRLHSNLVREFYEGFSKATMEHSIFIEDFASFFKCMRISCDDFPFSDAAHPNLRSFVLGICQNISTVYEDNVIAAGDGITDDDSVKKEAKSNVTKLVGYVSNYDVSEEARIDLDVLQIDIFMRTRAYEAALDYYRYGQNSFDTTGVPISLQKLAMLPDNIHVNQVNLFSTYFGASFADDMILQAIQRQGKFSEAPSADLSDLVTRTLQAMVSYIAIVWTFQSSVTFCDTGAIEDSLQYLSSGVAFFVGSIASLPSTRASGDGFLLYSLGVEECSKFKTCDTTGEANSNYSIFKLLNKIQGHLKKLECGEVQSLLDSSVLPLLQVPSLQGILDHSNYASNPKNTFAAGYALANSVLPIVNESNASSAEKISELFGSPFEPINSVNKTLEVYQAVRDVLPSMNINCNEVDLSLCHPHSSEYRLPSYVTSHASIGYDIAHIKIAIGEDQVNEARGVYSNGLNSVMSSQADLRSLQSLSTEATAEMLDEPLFNLFLYSHSSRDVSYADKYVDEAFETSADDSLVAETIVVFNVWMYATHNLYKTLESCESDSPIISKILHDMDVAAAYWIGDADITKKGHDGNLLYALNKDLDEHFENLQDSNKNMVKLFAKAKYHVFTQGCSHSSNKFEILYSLVSKIITEMKIPLVKGLIHSLKSNDKDRVLLYSRAVMPMLAVCNPSDYEILHDKLLNQEYNPKDADFLVDFIYEVLPCLGLSCDQVGIHDTLPMDYYTTKCLGDLEISLLEFVPKGNFKQHSKLDIDIREIDILMQMQAYRPAKDIFLYGSNASVSLASLALNSASNSTPKIELYRDYFETDTYTTDLPQRGFDVSEFGLTDLQGKIFSLRFSQTLLLEHAALERVFDSAAVCKPGSDTKDLTDAWNIAAAFLLGSLDRSREIDSTNWYSPYDLAQTYCAQFQTCSSSNRVSAANKEMTKLLNTGRSFAERNDCDGIQETAEKLRSSLLAPLIQAALSSAIRLSHPHYNEDDIAEGYVYTQTLLPLIKEIDASVASTIETLFMLGADESFPGSIGQSLFSEFSKVFDRLNVDCSWIGETNDQRICTMPDQEDEGLSVLGIVLIVLIIIFAIIFMYKVSYKDQFKVKEGWSNKRNSLGGGEKSQNGFSVEFSDQTSESSDTTPIHVMSFNGYRPKLSAKASNILDLIAKYGDDKSVLFSFN